MPPPAESKPDGDVAAWGSPPPGSPCAPRRAPKGPPGATIYKQEKSPAPKSLKKWTGDFSNGILCKQKLAEHDKGIFDATNTDKIEKISLLSVVYRVSVVFTFVKKMRKKNTIFANFNKKNDRNGTNREFRQKNTVFTL
jgi:hypothetical protein